MNIQEQSADPRKEWQLRPSPVKLNYINQYAVGRTALDVGTGAGFYANALVERGFQVVAIDVEKRLKIGYPYIQASVSAVPLVYPFDTVLAFDVLEHEVHETRALSELRRLTAKRLILSVPNADDHLLTPYNLTYKHHIDKTHQREYTVEELRLKLERSGFQVHAIQKEGPVNPAILAEFMPNWLRKLTRLSLKGSHRLHLLRNQHLMADLFVVAE